MTAREGDEELESQLAQWRQYVQARRELQSADADELEDHLRGSVDELVAAGLSADEAFLVAVKRMGSLDELSREFAREHSERLWKQLVLTGDGGGGPVADTRSRRDLWARAATMTGPCKALVNSTGGRVRSSEKKHRTRERKCPRKSSAANPPNQSEPWPVGLVQCHYRHDNPADWLLRQIQGRPRRLLACCTGLRSVGRNRRWIVAAAGPSERRCPRCRADSSPGQRASGGGTFRSAATRQPTLRALRSEKTCL